jgi:hypothetical protein
MLLDYSCGIIRIQFMYYAPRFLCIRSCFNLSMIKIEPVRGLTDLPELVVTLGLLDVILLRFRFERLTCFHFFYPILLLRRFECTRVILFIFEIIISAFGVVSIGLIIGIGSTFFLRLLLGTRHLSGGAPVRVVCGVGWNVIHSCDRSGIVEDGLCFGDQFEFFQSWQGRERDQLLAL